ncbi:hypothetical protein HRTV-18_gp93 [Halorubrum virus HRTV-18]|nr:hypothetical protein HRTV-18_gp93 [Halorubrum virus HRTV-18]UBF19925.1 hypothetical protein HRTV-20_gp93 [Halorubrum virus HRTV-20]
MKRREFLKTASTVATIGGVVATAGCVGGGSSLEITSHRASSGMFGGLEIVGTAKNTSNRRLSYAQVEGVFYDSRGTQLESGFDNINNLGAGRTWEFSIPYLGFDDSRVHSYEVFVR